MSDFSIFLSIVYVVHNQANNLDSILKSASDELSPLVSDYELIIIDNASKDNTLSVIKKLIGEGGYPNVQVYALTKEVDSDTASWVGLENALGDAVVILDPLLDNIAFLPNMLGKMNNGVDVVFAHNENQQPQTFPYKIGRTLFNSLYRLFCGIDLSRDAPRYRLLNRNVVNFILQHPQPPTTYRHLPATGGFTRVNMTYCSRVLKDSPKRIKGEVHRSLKLLFSTTQAPMRLVTLLSLFGAGANVFYSIYVVLIGLFRNNVSPGWISISLQQSGMFFLISLVLLVLGEYILNVLSAHNDGPSCHIGQEFTSARITRETKLNVEDVIPPTKDEER